VRRGAYLLPSAFTIGNMLLGFYAVVLGLRGTRLPYANDVTPYFAGDPGAFQKAALLVFAAALLDSIDGRIARLTGTESDFGKEYDSLADAATFGMVPALLTYLWGLHTLGRMGWLVPLFFFVCTATRLARFNVQAALPASDRWFVGLPAPAAAGAVCSLLFVVPDSEWRPWLNGLLLATLIVVGTLEVSTFRYWSPKQIHFRRRWSYRALLVLAAAILLISFQPRLFFPVAAALYTVSGPLGWLVRRVRPAEPEPEGEDEAAAAESEPQESTP
jgi:CDP-diacylglycerol--serine O-phosphatidyltransferase